MSTHDVIILGAGMAGVSLAGRLAGRARIAVLEVEDQPARHTTGRSAAMYTPGYGNAVIQALTRAGKAFFDAPPEGFTDHPLMTPRDVLYIAAADQFAALDEAEALGAVPIAVEQALGLCPILRPERVARAAVETGGYDMDVMAILQGFLKMARQGGAEIVMNARDQAILRGNGLWRVSTAAGDFAAPILVNAAGAWGDVVACAAGARPRGLTPLRRTAMLLAGPPGCQDWPVIMDAEENFYLKPDSGRLLLSGANEDPDVPRDAAPDELDIAIAIDRFETAADFPVRRIEHKWAGLRTFAPDRTPVVGYDGEVEGFFWLTGQGGYGIQTAPGLSALAAALVLREAPPPELEGFDPALLSPSRL
jgi:D-arginine dehydrogenase